MIEKYKLLKVSKDRKEITVVFSFSEIEFKTLYQDWEYEMNRLVYKYGLIEDELYFVEMNADGFIEKVYFASFSYGVDTPFDGCKESLNYFIEYGSFENIGFDSEEIFE